jgi:hypothetical protein
MPSGAPALALGIAVLLAASCCGGSGPTSYSATAAAQQQQQQQQQQPQRLKATQLARTRIITSLQWCPGKNPPPPPPPPRGVGLALRPCNASDPQQRWVFASDHAVSPAGDGQLCLTRAAADAAAPLYTTKCRGSAGRLDPVQQWKYNTGERIITTGQGRGCLCSTEKPADKGQIHCRYPSCVDSQHPRVSSNEFFDHDPSTGWIWSNCSGANCPNTLAVTSEVQQADGPTQRYCVTSMRELAPERPAAPAHDAPTPAELAAHPANYPSAHPTCIPWSIHPHETRPGWYHDAGMDGMVLTANDTVISIHEAEKYHHQDDNNQIDLVIRRSFDQGASSSFYCFCYCRCC